MQISNDVTIQDGGYMIKDLKFEDFSFFGHVHDTYNHKDSQYGRFCFVRYLNNFKDIIDQNLF